MTRLARAIDMQEFLMAMVAGAVVILVAARSVWLPHVTNTVNMSDPSYENNRVYVQQFNKIDIKRE